MYWLGQGHYQLLVIQTKSKSRSKSKWSQMFQRFPHFQNKKGFFRPSTYHPQISYQSPPPKYTHAYPVHRYSIRIPFTCQTFAICGQHILKLDPGSKPATHSILVSHQKPPRNHPETAQKTTRKSTHFSNILLASSFPQQFRRDRATFMPKLCQLFADLTFVAGADFDFWFEFKRRHYKNNKSNNTRGPSRWKFISSARYYL